LPTDFLGTNSSNPHEANYHLWTAAGDSDVDGSAGCDLCQTFHLHDRATKYRQSTVVQGTGHAWFHDGGGTSWFTGPCSIGEANTHLIQLGHFLPLIKHYVEGNVPATDFLWRQYEHFHPIGVDTSDPCIVVTNEYRNGSDSGNFMIDDYQTQTGTGTSSSGGSVTFNVTNLQEGRLDDNNSTFTWSTSDPFNGATQASSSDSSRGVVFDWSGADRYCEWAIIASQQDFSDDLYLSFRGAQGTQHPNTLAVLDDLTFTVTLRDGGGTTSSIHIGVYEGGLEQPYQRSGGWHNEMEVNRLRLTDFLNNGSGLDLTDVVAVRFNFGPSWGSNEGRIVIDELMLTNDLPPAIAGAIGISLPYGAPDLIPPDVPTTITVRITASGESYVPGSGMLHYRYDGGAFQTDPLTPLGGDLFEATLPAPECTDNPEYYFSAAGDVSGTVYLPLGAPADTMTASVGIVMSLFADDFETDTGWTTEILGATSGQWQRGVPVNDPSWDYDPASDSDGSGRCYLTQNELGNTDVDAGSVRLTSPTLNMSASDFILAYDYFLYLTDQDGTDRLLVEIDPADGAGTWTEIARHDTNGGLSWRHFEIDRATIVAAGVTPSATTKVRFTANDGDVQSIVEGGLDAFELFAVQCDYVPTCDDGIQNQGEDRIDCGGPCPPCDCTSDGGCQNGVFCDGAEVCDAYGECQAGGDPCPGQLCDEDADECVDCFVDGDCDDGLFCSGVETCDAGTCLQGSDPCPGQSCDEINDQCVEGPAVIYEWALDVDPGWTTAGQWAHGQPTGGGGEYGNPDPTSGYTGNNVYGYNLAGDYENSLPETHLTSTAIDCSGLSDVTLKFWRWLGVERSTYDHAYIRVSNNGSNWTTVWENPDSAVEDSSWQELTYDISAVADDHATVYLRWTMGTTDTSWRYCGWNIDDIQIIAVGGPEPTCDDGIQNQGEDRIDCGGPCPPCDCLSDSECDDGQFCTGVETCDDYGHCQAGAAVDCNDGVDCTEDSCNDGTDTCDNVPNDALCDNGVYCDGDETCDPVADCQDGTAVDCDDGVNCTEDSCNESADSCDNLPNDVLCDNGLYCDGDETCDPVADCQPGTAVDCDDGVDCTEDTCNEGTDSCDNLPNDALCDNGVYCDGAETCDPVADCQPGAAVDCDDGVDCTDDSCNEGTDSCDNVPNDSVCDNGLYCDGAEVCDPVTDCQLGTAVNCDDGVGCTEDSCNEGTESCNNPPNDALCDNGLYCDGAETCDPVADCQPGTAVDCDDGVDCTDDSCDEGTDSCDNLPNDGLCDNGVYCDGAETCDPVADCQPGTAVDCDDGVGCAEDSCNEGTDACDNVPNDALCDNGLYCDGAETCDSVTDCQPGIAVDCDDGVDCTDDSCNEGTDSCDNLPNDALCDNGVYCDGDETCDPVADCQPGAYPCLAGEWCDEDADMCLNVCGALAAYSCRNHDAAGRLCMDLGISGGIESRLGGVIELDIELDDASGFGGGVTVDCSAAWDGAAAALAVGSTVTVTFDEPLPDQAFCTVALDCGASVCVRGLQGDTNRDGLVSTGDASIIKPHFGDIPTGANAEFDFDVSGVISTGDFSQVKPLFGHTAPACP
jgi:hypothetical protein